MDIHAKVAFLAQLDHEVNKFHPLLLELFRRLPDIQTVEYCHGPNEKGADFLLERVDTTINESTWIGVVVKVGKIQQDTTDIERQIDECGMPRFVKNGADKITPREVWVVNSETVTANAKEKVNHKFATRKIAFIAAQKLVELIDKNASFLWQPIPTPVSNYLNALQTQIIALDSASSLVSNKGQRVYVELDLKDLDEDPYQLRKRGKTKFTTLLKALEDHRFVFVQGEMGSGKSKLLRHTALEISAPDEVISKRRIPLFTSYRTLVDAFGGDVSKFCDSVISGFSSYVDMAEYELVVFIDGVDEVSRNEEECCAKLIKSVDTLVAGGSKVVAACRQFSNPENNLQVSKVFRRFEVKGLSYKKMMQFVEQCCDAANIPKSLLRDLQKSELFRQMPQNPIAAILLSNLLAENDQNLPSNITELYSRSVQLMLGKWDSDKGVFFSQKEYEAAQRACGKLAQFLLDSTLSDTSRTDALNVFEEFLNKRNIGISAKDLFEKVLSRCGILGTNIDGSRVFFRHRSFAEYLYANEAIATNALTIDSRALTGFWSNIFFFYIGLRKDCPEILEEIMSLPVSSEQGRWAKVLQSGRYLMAGFTSPYEIVERYFDSILIEAASLFLDVCDGDTITKLNRKPEMFVLWFMQHMLRQNYGYDFFRKALDAATLKIDEALIDADKKSVALFFAATIGLELKDYSTFQYLVEKVKTDRLRLSVSLAMECESSLHIDLSRTSYMKKHRKKLGSLMPSDHHQKNLLMLTLFEKPISVRSHTPKD